jgi:hypothetical protein
MSRRCGEVLKADGKPKMTSCDGYELAISRSGALWRQSATVRIGTSDQPTRAAEAPARAPGRCLTVVTTAKMTATAKAIEKAAKTKRGTILRAP